MIVAALPADEHERLAELRSYSILDTPPEPAFDRLTRLGARLFEAPIVLVSLIDQNRQWFKSCYGLAATETGRDASFCSHAILNDEPLVIADAEADPRFADNPLVTGEPKIRFYAGAPLIAPSGRRLGTFCVIDTRPRPPVTEQERQTLEDLAALAIEEMELRRSARELAEATNALRASESRFNAFMDHSPAVALMKDLDGRICYLNAAAESIWNIRATDWVGKTDAEIWPADVAEQVRSSDRHVLENGPEAVVEQLPSPDGDREFLALKFPFTDGVGHVMFGEMSVDITEQKRLERALQEVNEALLEETYRAEQASRLKSEFLANMSHELRTPLNGIIGFSELLADGKGGPLTPRQQRFMDNILLSARHLLHLINDLLDLAKIEAGRIDFRPEPIRVTNLLSEVLDSIRSLADLKQIRLTSKVDPDAEDAYVDPARFKQVAYNYLSNAIKFTPERGTVAVEVRSEAGDTIRLDVTDTGIGIDESDLSRLFHEFEQLETGPAKKFGGTGLGLALVKKLVTLQGGRVEVSSLIGQGSRFSAILPRTCNIGSSASASGADPGR